jgi:hypothetical protein
MHSGVGCAHRKLCADAGRPISCRSGNCQRTQGIQLIKLSNSTEAKTRIKSFILCRPLHAVAIWWLPMRRAPLASGTFPSSDFCWPRTATAHLTTAPRSCFPVTPPLWPLEHPTSGAPSFQWMWPQRQPIPLGNSSKCSQCKRALHTFESCLTHKPWNCRINPNGFVQFVYPTKRTNILDLHFTRKNIVIALGAFEQ